MLSSYKTLSFVLLTALVAYAALAGCYKLKNFDLGWQLATGRYLAETGQIPRHDAFSYTAAGREWVYPVGGGVFFYGVYRLGGYPALTLVGLLACVTTAAFLLLANLRGRGSCSPPLGLASLWLIALAVPAVAERTGARADLFSTLLFAATLSLLWRFHLGLSDRLYLLPFLFVGWANLHQGFIFGLFLLVPFLIAELLARAPWRRLRRLLIWTAASAAAVLINPWGWRLYASLWRVRQDMEFQRGFIGEASGVPLGWWRWRELLHLRDPDSGFWILAALAAAGLLVSLLRRRLLPALVLALALSLGLRYARAEAFLTITAAVVLPSLFGGVRVASLANRAPEAADRSSVAPRLAAHLAVGLALAALLAVRSADLLTSRCYIARGDTTAFGLGLSWWFPERALDFIARERLPGRLYNDYNLGGWAIWRLWPQYQVYIDGRAAPFTPDVFLEQQALLLAAPDSPQWQAFLDRRGIHTLLVSLARYGGYRVSPAALCASPGFRLVYMDEVSGVWVRARPENQPWLERLAQPCPSEPFPATGGSSVERYNFLANAGELYHQLGRDADALKAYQQAERVFPEDANLRLSVARVWHNRGKLREARLEYQNSLALRPSPGAWHGLGLLEMQEGRYREAAGAFRQAAQRAVLPKESYRMLAEAYLALKQPEQALLALEKARATSRYRGPAAGLGRDFLAALEEARHRARQMLGR